MAKVLFFFFQAEDGIRDLTVTGVQTCALPIYPGPPGRGMRARRAIRCCDGNPQFPRDRKSTRLNSSHSQISYAVFCLKKKKNTCEEKQSTEQADNSESVTEHTRCSRTLAPTTH